MRFEVPVVTAMSKCRSVSKVEMSRWSISAGRAQQVRNATIACFLAPT